MRDLPDPLYGVTVDDISDVVNIVKSSTHLSHMPTTRPDSYASVRQLAGRKGEVWGAESAADKLIVIKSE